MNLHQINHAPTTIEDEDRMILHISHETHYHYDHPVQMSKHYLRLHPLRDQYQSVIEHDISISIDNYHNELFDDVFGNHVNYLEMHGPYTDVSINLHATVSVARPKIIYASKAHHQRFPLLLLPWQRQMMLPYLLSPELPEFELKALTDYAMSFVEKNNYEIMDTLNDLNQTIYNEYTFVNGLTDITTTPYEVFVHRRGVCQDFANLFICLARLINIPARYRSGYIYIGPDHGNQTQSEGSHAWVEVYLPWLGWCGYDPTNGYLASNDHIRVACGRNYFDAAPTSGTIFGGQNRESLTVNVQVSK